MSLYEEIGGAAAVNAAVDLFYKKVFSDDLLLPFFEKTDRAKQMAKQKAFLTYAFGGVPAYNGRSMRLAHQAAVEKGLTDIHFDRVAEHLKTTLQELKVSARHIDQVMQLAGSLRGDILGRH